VDCRLAAQDAEVIIAGSQRAREPLLAPPWMQHDGYGQAAVKLAILAASMVPIIYALKARERLVDFVVHTSLSFDSATLLLDAAYTGALGIMVGRGGPYCRQENGRGLPRMLRKRQRRSRRRVNGAAADQTFRQALSLWTPQNRTLNLSRLSSTPRS
jgi:hypothetical protein